MRFNDRITFITHGTSYYDPDIGEVVEGNDTRVTVPCQLSALGVERTRELFGSVNRRILVARLQRPYREYFDKVEVKGEPYQVERHSNYRKGVLFLEGTVNVNIEGDPNVN